MLSSAPDWFPEESASASLCDFNPELEFAETVYHHVMTEWEATLGWMEDRERPTCMEHIDTIELSSLYSRGPDLSGIPHL